MSESYSVLPTFTPVLNDQLTKLIKRSKYTIIIRIYILIFFSNKHKYRMTLSCYNPASSCFNENELIMYPAAKTSLIALLWRHHGKFERVKDIFNLLPSLSLLLALAINYLLINYSNNIPIGSLLDSTSESDSKSNELKISKTRSLALECSVISYRSFKYATEPLQIQSRKRMWKYSGSWLRKVKNMQRPDSVAVKTRFQPP